MRVLIDKEVDVRNSGNVFEFVAKGLNDLLVNTGDFKSESGRTAEFLELISDM